jgi:hypothetical protein
MKKTMEGAKITEKNGINRALKIFINKNYPNTSREDILNHSNFSGEGLP